MGFVTIAKLGEAYAFVDSDAPTVPLGEASAVGEAGKVLFDLSKFIGDRPGLASITGTVTTVLGISPVDGDVDFDADDFSEGTTNKLLTAAERTAISGNTTSAAANATALSRMITQQTITDQATLSFDCDLGLNGTVTLAGNRTLPLLTNPVVGETAFMITKQDATGSRTLDTSAYHQPDGVAATLTTTANSVDLISVYVESATVMHLTILHDSKLPS